jgi:antirestriction protein ArdC
MPMPCSALLPRAGTRLTQSLVARAGYAMEELVAEIGAAFLCADLGITPETRDDHAAYMASSNSST